MKTIKKLLIIGLFFSSILTPSESKAVGLRCRTPYNQSCTYAISFSLIIITYTIEYEGYKRSCAPDGDCDCSPQFDCQNEPQTAYCIPSPAQ